MFLFIIIIIINIIIMIIINIIIIIIICDNIIKGTSCKVFFGEGGGKRKMFEAAWQWEIQLYSFTIWHLFKKFCFFWLWLG